MVAAWLISYACAGRIENAAIYRQTDHTPLDRNDLCEAQTIISQPIHERW
jgi:hypothetical protein